MQDRCGEFNSLWLHDSTMGGGYMVETWRDVVGYEGRYRVSDQGNVWSCLTNKLLHKRPTHKGRLQVTLLPESGKANKQTVYVHRLVLEAFVGPCPDGMECCHYNDIPDDNRLENLRWDTHHANLQDQIRNNGGPANSRRTHCKNGHEFTPDNIARRTDAPGARRCRECTRLATRRRRARLRNK